MKFRQERPPVVLLGGLAQTWPLGSAGIAVVVVTDESKNPALASRYVRGHCLLPPHADDHTIVSRLLALGRRLFATYRAKSPLFCGNDYDLALIYRHHARLADVFVLFTCPSQLGFALLDKGRFQVLARTHDLPIPRVYDWDGPNGVQAAPGPILVKPKTKLAWKGSSVLMSLFGNGKARAFDNAAALRAHAELMPLTDLIVIQDYIPGDDNRICSFHGLADRGELLAWFLGRKIRTFPKLTGESSFIELTREPELFELGSTITRRLGLTGPFKIDFKRHAGTGAYYLLEINARFTLWNYLGAVNGINIPKAAYEYLVDGVRPAINGYDTKYKWNSFLLDYHAYRELHRLGETTLFRWLQSLLQTRRVQNVFSWKDPLPFMIWIAGYVMDRVDRWLSTAS